MTYECSTIPVRNEKEKNGFQSIYQKKKKERSPLVLFSFLLIWECFPLVWYSTYSNRQRARIYYQSKDRWDFDEREVTYKDRAMNAKKTVYLLSCLGPNPKPAYSEWTVLPVFTPRSTRSLFFVLFRVRRFYLEQSEPKFTDQVTEAMLVVIPAAVKIDRTMHSLLDHRPSPASCSLVTVYIKGAWTIRVDCVNTADPLTRFVQLSAVLSYWR